MNRRVDDRIDEDIETLTLPITDEATILSDEDLEFLYSDACHYYTEPLWVYPDCDSLFNKLAT